jgi:hypothetical protein
MNSKSSVLTFRRSLLSLSSGRKMETASYFEALVSFYPSIYLRLYSPCEPWPLFQFLNLYTVGRTPWEGDQPVTRPLPAHRTAQTQNKLTDIHASSGIRTHDPSVRAGEDGSCPRTRGHCDRHISSRLHEFTS